MSVYLTVSYYLKKSRMLLIEVIMAFAIIISLITFMFADLKEYTELLDEDSE